ncbi:uncharacterized protein LOC143066839 [Mytilus galloprovincialis]|uniref:uncharacterized protein LOC143066839 n=1 Tax=Mytilus galloprovincialis TaxID=29158 RepID=UPI003F7B467D
MEHKVELLKDGESINELENLRKVNLKEIACSKHMDQKCVTYCLNCDKSLCASCLIRPFQYEKLNKVYEDKYLLLTDLKSKIDDCYPFFEEKAADFRKRDDDEVDKHNKVTEEIFNRKNEVKDAVTKEASALVEVMKSIWDTDSNPVKSERERLCQVEQDLKARKNLLDKVTLTQEPALVFSSAENINRDIPEKSFLEEKPPELFYIKPIEKPIDDMKNVLGSIIRKPKINLLKVFKVDFPEINGLVSLNEDICVMFNKDNRRFKYFTISDFKFITVKNDIKDVSTKERYGSVKIFDITNYKEEILVSDDTFQLRRLKNDGTFQKVAPSITIDQLSFYGIHAVNDKDIFVGFTNRQGYSSGFLELINFCDSEMRRVECGRSSNKRLFGLPKKITTDINGDIYVIDQLDCSQRVVSVGTWGQLKWIYNGHQSLNPVSTAEKEEVQVEEDAMSEFTFGLTAQGHKEGDFVPNDIVTTPSGLVLVSEKTTNAIHVLSKNGQFICNCLSDSVIIGPTSLCFNKKGQLMIGCSDSRKTKLHVVEFIE